jgi:hypothetical protein
MFVPFATGYGLEGQGIESRWGRDFPHLSRPALGPTPPPVQWIPGLSWGYTAARAWRWSITPISSRGQERVELYLYFPYGPYGLYRASGPVKWWPLPLLLLCLIKQCCNYLELITFMLWRYKRINLPLEENRGPIFISGNSDRIMWNFSVNFACQIGVSDIGVLTTDVPDFVTTDSVPSPRQVLKI